MISLSRLIFRILSILLFASTLSVFAGELDLISQAVEPVVSNVMDSKSINISKCSLESQSKNELNSKIILAERGPNCCGQCTVPATGGNGCYFTNINGTTTCRAC